MSYDRPGYDEPALRADDEKSANGRLGEGAYLMEAVRMRRGTSAAGHDQAQVLWRLVGANLVLTWTITDSRRGRWWWRDLVDGDFSRLEELMGRRFVVLVSRKEREEYEARESNRWLSTHVNQVKGVIAEVEQRPDERLTIRASEIRAGDRLIVDPRLDDAVKVERVLFPPVQDPGGYLVVAEGPERHAYAYLPGKLVEVLR